MPTRKNDRIALFAISVGAMAALALMVFGGSHGHSASYDIEVLHPQTREAPKAPKAPLVPAAPTPPKAPTAPEAEAPRAPAPAPTPAVDEGTEPRFTPFTVAPRMINTGEVLEALGSEYPPLLRDAGIGGTVQVYFFINEQGEVQELQVSQSSGNTSLDQAALAVGSRAHFEPAKNREEIVSVWISMPITFQVR